MKKILKLGIVGGGPGSWIGNIHRIASRIDGKYKIYAGCFSRNHKINNNFGEDIVVVQIAGLIARRIICNVKLKDKTNQGDRYGIIKFGSRVDIEFPDNFDLLVSVGQQCIGGETIIAQENKTSKIKSKRDFKKI
mgnify:CR=1 FL=1